MQILRRQCCNGNDVTLCVTFLYWPPIKKPSKARRNVTLKCPHPKLFSSEILLGPPAEGKPGPSMIKYLLKYIFKINTILYCYKFHKGVLSFATGYLDTRLTNSWWMSMGRNASPTKCWPTGITYLSWFPSEYHHFWPTPIHEMLLRKMWFEQAYFLLWDSLSLFWIDKLDPFWACWYYELSIGILNGRHGYFERDIGILIGALVLW